jgi:hypothetical protein
MYLLFHVTSSYKDNKQNLFYLGKNQFHKKKKK